MEVTQKDGRRWDWESRLLLNADDAGGQVNKCVMSCMRENGEAKRIDVLRCDGLHREGDVWEDSNNVMQRLEGVGE